MDAQLADASPHRLDIFWQSIGKAEDTRRDKRLGALISQLAFPLPGRVGLFDTEYS